MAKVITMGEIMLRLSTPNNEKFIQADEFDLCYGGAETIQCMHTAYCKMR